MELVNGLSISKPLHSSFNKNLWKFGQGLKAPKEYAAKGGEMLDKIRVMLLQTASRRKNRKNPLGFTVAESCVAGSVGKGTDAIVPDFDIVFFINSSSEQSPFPSALAFFHSVIEENQKELKIMPGSIAEQSWGIQFQLKNGIEVELLTGSREQLDLIRAKMIQDKKQTGRHSGSLGKEASSFMTGQSGFVHTLTRLGRFWFDSIYFRERVPRGASIIQLIFVAAALEEEQGGRSILRGFFSALEMVGKISSVRLAFRKPAPDGRWECVPGHEFKNMTHLQFGNNNAVDVDVSLIVKRACFLIDPSSCSPNNDLLLGLDNRMTERFMEVASVTTQRLKAMVSDNIRLHKKEIGQFYIKFENLFEPQAPSLREGQKPCAYLLTSIVPFSLVPEIEIRRDIDEVRLMTNLMTKGIFTTANSISRGSPRGGKSVQTAVQQMIERTFQKKLCSFAVPHENHDVTITVPYKIGKSNYAIVLSMSWDG